MITLLVVGLALATGAPAAQPIGGQPSDGQGEILPLLAKCIQLLAATGLVHEQSGVFIVYSDLHLVRAHKTS
jgi:hypothetical protein